MTPCDALLQALRQLDPTDQYLAASIFGTADVTAMGQWITNLCCTHLHQAVVDCEFWEVSVSFTVGLRLESGQRVVVKFRSPENINLETLQAVCQVQQHLANQGFPAPHLILPPCRAGNAWVSIEALLNRGENRDAHDPAVRRAMAVGLAQQIELAKPWVGLPGLPLSRFRARPLWGKPHNALFDFERTAAGAEWIDAIATSAQAVFLNNNAPLRIGHMDWSVKNMRFEQNQISAVYDWDSLRLENELVILGNALKGYLTTWYVDVQNLVPTSTEIQEFIQDYEAARGEAFTVAEQGSIESAFLYSMAYTARCEHAIDPAGERWAGSFREALQGYIDGD